MRESILKVVLDELKTIQIVCLHKKSANDQPCNATLELTMERVQKVAEDGGEIRCPICGSILRADNYKAIGDLAKCITTLTKRRADLSVRFVIPQPPQAA